MTFLFIVFPFSKTNAALLNVTIKPDSVQIDSAGSTNLTVTVKDSLNAPVSGAAITFTAIPATCTAPGGSTTNASGVNNTTITFTGPATTSVVVCKITATATSGPDSGTATVSIIVGKGYVPLVPIPGVGTPTSFPAYLVGLYKLALISIAIFAMMMILYGGFKYMTSAGNPALMGDAKDAIWSAIFGLILALLSWLILSTVNPELTMIKTPGTSISLFTPSTSTARIQCAQEDELTSPVCNCLDKTPPMSNPTGISCNSLCSTDHCFVIKPKIGELSVTYATALTMYTPQQLRAFATKDPGSDLNPTSLPEGASFVIDLDYSTVFNKPATYTYDNNGDGTCDTPFNGIPSLTGNWAVLTMYRTSPLYPVCKLTTNPPGERCDAKICGADSLGHTAEYTFPSITLYP